MKVCAHIQFGPFNNGHERFDTIGEARAYFRNTVAGNDFGTGTDEQTMDLYPQCTDCTSGMNFHDWPMTRWVVTEKGTIRMELV